MNTPCPKCKGQPQLERVKASYWRAACPVEHHPFRIYAHTMKTQRAALDEWEKMLADSKTPNAKAERPETAAKE